MRAALSPRAARAREDLADVRRPRDEVARRRNSLATPVSSRSSALCIRVLGRNGLQGSGETAAILYGRAVCKKCTRPESNTLLSTLSRFSSFACSRGGSPSRAHTATRAPRPRPTSPPAFRSARYPRFPPRARTPRPAVSQRSPAMSYDDEFDEPPPSRRGDLRVPHFVSRSETDYFNEVELMSEECASRSRDPRDPRSPSGPERTAPRATRPRRGTRGGKP